jgi:hypothetical protein
VPNGAGGSKPDQHARLHSRHGMVGESGNDGSHQYPCAVGWSLYDIALIIVITMILPFGLDADTIPQFQGAGVVVWKG